MSDKNCFAHKWTAAITVEITEGGYLEINQPDRDDEIRFLLTPDQAMRLSNYIESNLDEQRSKWGSGESGVK